MCKYPDYDDFESSEMFEDSVADFHACMEDRIRADKEEAIVKEMEKDAERNKGSDKALQESK